MAMTGPVVEKPGGDGWTMTFFLSNDLETAAPRPNDDDIELVSEPERLYRAVQDVARPGALDDDFSMLVVTFV